MGTHRPPWAWICSTAEAVKACAFTVRPCPPRIASGDGPRGSRGPRRVAARYAQSALALGGGEWGGGGCAP